MTVATAIHRMTVDEYVRIVRDLGWESTELVEGAGVPEVWLIDPRPQAGELLRHRHPEDGSYRTVDRFDVGENAGDLDVSVILGR